MKRSLIFAGAFLSFTLAHAQDEYDYPPAPAAAPAPAPVAVAAPAPTPVPVQAPVVAAPAPTPVPVAAPVATPPPSVLVIAPQERVEAAPVLRKRQHAMSWHYSSTATKTEFVTPAPTSTTTKTDMIRGELSFNYAYNFGFIELGVGLGSTTARDNLTDDKDTLGTFVLQGTVNLIENKPGNDVVPYLGLGLGSLVENFTISNADSRVIGGVATFAVGLKWFPFGEIFALDTSFSGSSISATSSGATVGNLDGTLGSFNIGFQIYF